MDQREKALWGRDDLQFPRFIVELIGVLTNEQLVTVGATMGLTLLEMQELFERATAANQRIKARKYFDEYGVTSKRMSSVHPNHSEAEVRQMHNACICTNFPLSQCPMHQHNTRPVT